MKKRIIPIIRNIHETVLLKLAESFYEGGIRELELALPSLEDRYKLLENDLKLIEIHFSNMFKIGIGTVLSENDVCFALNNNSSFIVTPVFSSLVIGKAKKEGLEVISGAFTPTEIYQCYVCGSDYIKLFPASAVSPSYIKDILTPMPFLKIIVTAGVNEKNLSLYFQAGACGAGISSYLTDRSLIEANKWSEITNRAKIILNLSQS